MFPPSITIPNRKSIPLAPLEIRDAGFQELIMSPLDYGEELVTGPGGLLSRGLLKPIRHSVPLRIPHFERHWKLRAKDEPC